MWRKILEFLKGGMVRLGLTRSIASVAEHRDIYINEDMYNNIDVWKALYAGYYSEWHDVRYQTIDGPKNRKMMTLNMAKTSAAEMASLVYNEKCEISIDNDAVADFVNDVLKKNKFDKKFQDFLEYSFAHSGMAIKPYVENDKMKLSFVTADCFIPIAWSNETITEAVFVNETRKGNKKYTLLEWHTWENDTYTVTNELYESSGAELGKQVPLDVLYPNLEPVVGMPRVKKPIFVYFKPNTANNIDIQSPLGISIFANALDTMRAIDTAYDSFHREFKLGRKRIVVPAHMIRHVIDPATGEQHRYFDDSDETYEAFSFGEDSDEIRDISASLRVNEHIAGINALLNLFAMQTGFSAGTFTFDGESMKTATEVVSEQSKTFKSKKSHEIIIEAALQELIGSIVDLGQLYGLVTAPDDYEVTVTFDDSIVEDQNAELTKIIQELSNKITPRKVAIMRYHGLTEKEAEDWMQEINEENATATRESVNFFGGRGD